jgi:hypothetical protein
MEAMELCFLEPGASWGAAELQATGFYRTVGGCGELLELRLLSCGLGTGAWAAELWGAVGAVETWNFLGGAFYVDGWMFVGCILYAI